MRAIHQLLAGFRDGDAISNEALCLRKIFRDWGYASDIACERRRIAPRARHWVCDIDGLTVHPDDIVILHLSIGSPLNARFEALTARKVILYHNITPADYFTTINPGLRDDLAEGRRQARRLAGAADVNLADSAFNAAELTAMGFRDVHVLPLVLDMDRLTDTLDPDILARFRDDLLTVLFVGRCVPNKRIEKILNIMFYLQRGAMPNSRFVHVGSHAGTEAYYSLLLAHAHELRLRNTHFLGPVEQASLNACYHRADVFLCMSEHEGFCVPLMEAMQHQVPIVALARAAVPETLDGAGILLEDADPALAAETLVTLAGDAILHAAVLKRQQRRLAAFRSRDVPDELRRWLAPLLS